MVMGFLIRDLPVFAMVSLLLYIVVYSLIRSRIGKRPFLRHLAVWALLCYGISLVYLTLLWYWPDITFRPEWYFLNLRPFIWVKETYEMGAPKMIKQLLLNIGMFVPLGILTPIVFPRARRFWQTALIALAATVLIETIQYFMGRSADIDDVIMNFAGGLLGYAFFALFRRLFRNFGWWKKMIRQD